MLTDLQKAHAESIMDPDPIVVPIPPERVTKILCCVPIRKPPVVLNAFLQTLKWQQFRDLVQLDFLFVDNFADLDPFAAESRELLQEFDAEIICLPNEGGDYGDGDGTRKWTKDAFTRLANAKNICIQKAMEARYDYVWFVDADVLCDPFTVQSLLDSAGHERYLADPRMVLPVVSGVYWTNWKLPVEGSTDQRQIGPQVWVRHPYHLDGKGWTIAKFREALVKRKRVQVGGRGACTLIPMHALFKGLSFRRFDGLAPGPMADGEDRHFCAWANRLHIQMVADPWPDIFHAYHPEEYSGTPDKLERLARPKLEKPGFGDLISAKVELLEPVPDQNGRMHTGLVEWVRGRIGSLNTLPSIEQTLSQMRVGTHRIMKINYPAQYVIPGLSLQSRLIRLSLFDAKPFSLPFVIEDEFTVNESGALFDKALYTREQIENV